MMNASCSSCSGAATAAAFFLPPLSKANNKPPFKCVVNFKTRKCTVYCCAGDDNGTGVVHNRHGKRNNRGGVADDDGGGGGGEREVKCHVEVISWRERRISAQIWVNADVQSVWDALTDYERLADFIPNLISSGRIPCPHPGRIWLEQRGLQRSLYWHIEAHVVLDLQEVLNSVRFGPMSDIMIHHCFGYLRFFFGASVCPTMSNDRELRFSMVDGDFKKFEGKWSVKFERRSSGTVLFYEVNVIPRINFPAIFLERIICSDLPVNLQALACRAERNFEGNQLSSPVTQTLTPLCPSSKINTAVIDEDKPLPLKESHHSSWGVFGKVCNLERPCLVDEVHLRRFDGLLEDGGVHRGVVASITVKAPVREVWNVLTSYERLPEIVPNLAISKILSRDNNKVRILQEGCKGLLYMVLHARVVLDLCEDLELEISFEQVEGDFTFFQGKWLLEQLGNHHTLLKYSVESKMHKNSFLSEAIVEEVIYEDLPSNLCAIRDYVEKMETKNSFETSSSATYTEEQTTPTRNEEDFGNDFDGLNLSRQRPRVPGLQRDIEVLKQELLNFIAEYGQEGFMPMRKQLRKHGRVDIEKAITRMGGFRRIASLMNLSLAYKNRKPKGYWDNLENLQEEINRFQRNWGMDLSYIPSRKSFERAGRYDIARALEKWGGLHEVSRLLTLKVRHPNRQGNLSKDKKIDNVTTSTSHREEGKLTSKSYVSQDTREWLNKLKDLDINWVE